VAKKKTGAKKPKKKTKRAPPKATLKVNGFEARTVRVGDLDPADYNPREIREANLRGLKASVERFGLTQPIVWNQRTEHVVGGHQRLKTLAPDSETDVVVVDLSLEREKVLNLALNNPHNQGRWTEDVAAVVGDVEASLPDLIEELNLDELVQEAPDLDPLPPTDLPGGGDSDSDSCECPRCGHEFATAGGAE